jgi:hypothetical protein
MSNAVTLDNVLGIDQLRRSGVAFGRERGNQLWQLDDVEDAPEPIGRSSIKLRAFSGGGSDGRYCDAR